MPAQSVVPAWHAQSPFAQTRLPRQICEQNPQLFLSVCRSTQALPQRASPEPQLVAHVPALQTSPNMQRLPQLPQLRGSDCRITHTPPRGPLQTTSPGAHKHVPFMHVAPAAHALPQLPQSPLLV